MRTNEKTKIIKSYIRQGNVEIYDRLSPEVTRHLRSLFYVGIKLHFTVDSLRIELNLTNGKHDKCTVNLSHSEFSHNDAINFQ